MKTQYTFAQQFFGYIFGCSLVAALFNWYDYVWLQSQLNYLVYFAISLGTAWFVAHQFDTNEFFKKVWSLAGILVLTSTIIAQILIWFGIAHTGIFHK